MHEDLLGTILENNMIQLITTDMEAVTTPQRALANASNFDYGSDDYSPNGPSVLSIGLPSHAVDFINGNDWTKRIQQHDTNPLPLIASQPFASPYSNETFVPAPVYLDFGTEQHHGNGHSDRLVTKCSWLH